MQTMNGIARYWGKSKIWKKKDVQWNLSFSTETMNRGDGNKCTLIEKVFATVDSESRRKKIIINEKFGKIVENRMRKRYFKYVELI